MKKAPVMPSPGSLPVKRLVGEVGYAIGMLLKNSHDFFV